jgi:hypothetical protein
LFRGGVTEIIKALSEGDTLRIEGALGTVAGIASTALDGSPNAAKVDALIVTKYVTPLDKPDITIGAVETLNEVVDVEEGSTGYTKVQVLFPSSEY